MFKKDYSSWSDENLIAAVCRGQEAPFTEVYRRYYQRIFRFLTGAIRSRTTAEDLVQEVFLRVVQSSDRFDPAYRFETWIFTIARNLVKNEYRKRSRQGTTTSLDDLTFAVSEEQLNEPATPLWMAKEESLFVAQAIDRAMTELSPEVHMILQLRYREGLEVNEVAQIIGCPVGTVKSRVYYGLRKLEKMLSPLNIKP